MVTTQEIPATSGTGAAAASVTQGNDAVDGELFTRELQRAASETVLQSIDVLLGKLAKSIPGASVSESGTIVVDSETTVVLSSSQMERMRESDEQFNSILELIEKLIAAGKEQNMVNVGGDNIRRTITIEDTYVRYAEVQRTANGAKLSTSSIAIERDAASALVNARNAGQTGSAGFQGMFASSEWRFEGILSRQAFSSLSVNTATSRELIIQEWAASGQSAEVDIWTYIQLMQLTDPLVFDLGDEGINLSSAEDGVYFDIKGDGSPVKTGFITGNNAFLYLDRNGNGVVDDVSELFGDQNGFANGFDALAQFDNNGDGVIDENDAIYSELRLWRDLNGDGVNRIEESMTLAEAGIKSINLNYSREYEKDRNGNVIGERSSFERTDGTSGLLADVYLRSL